MRPTELFSPTKLWEAPYDSQMEAYAFHETAAAAAALFIGPLVGHVVKSSLEWGANAAFLATVATLHKSKTIQGAAFIGGFTLGSLGGAFKGAAEIWDSASSLLFRCRRITH